MTSDPVCLCGHRDSEHLVNVERVVLGPGGHKRIEYTTGECAVHRRDRGPECGCQRFQEAREDAMNAIDMIARSGQRQVRYTIRPRYVADFGEAQAVAIEKAAEGHKNGLHDRPGSDAFKWALVICIGHQCMSKFAKDHGITVPFATFKQWVRDHGELDTHDGDCDFLALFCGVYQEFLPGATDKVGDES